MKANQRQREDHKYDAIDELKNLIDAKSQIHHQDSDNHQVTTKNALTSCLLPEFAHITRICNFTEQKQSEHHEIFAHIYQKISRGEKINIPLLNSSVASALDDFNTPENQGLVQRIKTKVNALNNIVIEQKIIEGDYAGIDEIIESNPDLIIFPPAVKLAIQYPDFHKVRNPEVTIIPQESENATILISKLCNRINSTAFLQSRFAEDLNRFTQEHGINEAPETERHLSDIATRYNIATSLIDGVISRSTQECAQR